MENQREGKIGRINIQWCHQRWEPTDHETVCSNIIYSSIDRVAVTAEYEHAYAFQRIRLKPQDACQVILIWHVSGLLSVSDEAQQAYSMFREHQQNGVQLVKQVLGRNSWCLDPCKARRSFCHGRKKDIVRRRSDKRMFHDHCTYHIEITRAEMPSHEQKRKATLRQKIRTVMRVRCFQLTRIKGRALPSKSYFRVPFCGSSATRDQRKTANMTEEEQSKGVTDPQARRAKDLHSMRKEAFRLFTFVKKWEVRGVSKPIDAPMLVGEAQPMKRWELALRRVQTFKNLMMPRTPSTVP